MKKAVSLALALSLTLMSLTACGNTASETTDAAATTETTDAAADSAEAATEATGATF